MKRLRGSKLRGMREINDVNPLEGMANLADCMLVLACGLMLSLIVNWNLDIDIEQQLFLSAEQASVQAVSEMRNSEEEELDEVEGYEELGKVYKDPKTGQLYMVPN